MKKLILFDFDDTLVNVYRFHEIAIFEAFREAMDLEVRLHKHKVDGQTAEWFLQDIISKNAEKNERKELFLKVSELYQSHFIKAFEQEKENVVLPGVRELLSALHERNHFPAILSGTPRSIIEAVLEKIGLLEKFFFLVSGDEETERLNLYKKGIEEASLLRIPKENIVVLGNSENEIVCSKQSGLRMISVATGSFSLEELKKSEPDAAFKDLSDTKKVLEAIEK